MLYGSAAAIPFSFYLPYTACNGESACAVRARRRRKDAKRVSALKSCRGAELRVVRVVVLGRREAALEEGFGLAVEGQPRQGQIRKPYPFFAGGTKKYPFTKT